MSVEDRSLPCAVTWRHDWAPHLFSFRTERPADLTFAPGQFVRLGVDIAGGERIFRAYSIVSPPSANHLEFYSIVVPDGPFTQPLSRIAVGDTLRIDPTAYGFLRVDRFEQQDGPGGRVLWLLATGTGIAPLLSILGDPAVWSRFDDIVVVHGVRRAAELAYHDTLLGWKATPPVAGARLLVLPALTTDDPGPDGALRGRIPALLADGTLERATGLAIAPDTARLMICGNPSMIKDARRLLGDRGLGPVRRDKPGQFIVENFW